MALQDKIEVALNRELIKRLLIRYFIDKGFDTSFHAKVYPPLLQDMVDRIPELAGKIEVIPHAIEIDPRTKFTRLGWDLFVLGSQRMFLGESEHTSLTDLDRCLAGDAFETFSRYEATPKRIIWFICRVLGDKKDGMIRQLDITNVVPSKVAANTYSAQAMWNRPKAIRPEGTPSV